MAKISLLSVQQLEYSATLHAGINYCAVRHDSIGVYTVCVDCSRKQQYMTRHSFETDTCLKHCVPCNLSAAR